MTNNDTQNIIEDSENEDPDIQTGLIVGSETSVEIDNSSQFEEEVDVEGNYDTDLEIDENKSSYDATGRLLYLETCKNLGTNPVSLFIRTMTEPEVNLRFHGIGSLGATAIANSLVTNTHILKLDLCENYIGHEGAKSLSIMLKENCYISDLNISRNCLGHQGCMWICEMLLSNIHLQQLDLSGNKFGDSCGNILAEAFKNNYKIAYLNLSDNDLGEKVGCALGPGINANDSIEILDLSWNQLRGKGAQEIAHGLKLLDKGLFALYDYEEYETEFSDEVPKQANCTLKILDLSWNGFSNIGALAIAEVLRANNTITEINLRVSTKQNIGKQAKHLTMIKTIPGEKSNNRIGCDGALAFAKGMDGNNTLEVLKFSYNPIGIRGVTILVTSVQRKQDSAIKELDFKGILADEELCTAVKILEDEKGIVITIDYPIISPLKRVQDYIKENKEKWIELFTESDPEKSMRVSKKRFMNALKELDLMFTIEEIASLFEKIQLDDQGRVLYKDVILGFSKDIPEQVTV